MQTGGIGTQVTVSLIDSCPLRGGSTLKRNTAYRSKRYHRKKVPKCTLDVILRIEHTCVIRNLIRKHTRLPEAPARLPFKHSPVPGGHHPPGCWHCDLAVPVSVPCRWNPTASTLRDFFHSMLCLLRLQVTDCCCYLMFHYGTTP